MLIRRHHRIASRLEALEAKIDGLNAQILDAAQKTSPIETATGIEVEPTHEDPLRDVMKQLERIQDILQVLYDREPEMRERLGSVRGNADYERAFDEKEPLVSVVIPTYDRGDLLLSRSIPSALAQTYTNIEIVVVGDCAPEDTGRRLSELSDSRISYQNLPYRGPYPHDPRDLWHVAGIPPRNLGVTLAKGRWIAPLDDDDAFHPHHVERLLKFAQQERHEVAYGKLRCLMNDGSEFSLGTYPPQFGHFGWQSAIFHSGLRFFEMELADALFFSPADWSLCRRMLRVGVRFGFLKEAVTDHYESRFAPTADEIDH